MHIINKFGGEILGNADLVRLAVKRLKEQLVKKQKPVVVVSALAGVTDKLLKLSHSDGDDDKKIVDEIISQHQAWARQFGLTCDGLGSKIDAFKKDLNFQESNKLARQDRTLSYGEKLSALLFAELLNKEGIQAARLTAEELGVITDENFGDANVIYNDCFRNIGSRLKNFSCLPVITGFVGKTKRGKTTTLGRGGSDTTACLLGACHNPSRVILWKNVPGVLSADPKIVKNAKTIKYLTYGEAEESGKVIHDKAIALIKGREVVLEVAYIADPAKKTIIDNDALSKKGVKIISSKGNLQMFIISSERITRPGALFEISGILSKAGVNMVLIRNTKESLYIVFEKNSHHLISAEREIRNLGYQVLAKDVSMVNAVGQIDWKTAERFNQVLYRVCPDTDLGAFPYKNCLILEAIVEPVRVKKLINKFHKEFIEKL